MPWRVLLADDDLEICALIATILRKGPYELTVCHNAETAFDFIVCGPSFDLLISDFMLPGISGIDLITRVREHPATAEVPIVMITGHDLMDAAAKSAGANAFLTKPFALSEFRSIVAELLPGAERAFGT